MKDHAPIKKTGKKASCLIVRLSVATMAAIVPSMAKAQSLNCFDNLLYGEISTCGAPGTVTVRPDNSTASTCVSIAGVQSRARCIVTQGFPFRPIQISITAPNFNITNGTTNMSVTNFHIITNANGPTSTITAPFVSVPIGATLNVGGTQAGGTYTGTFGISAILQ